MVKLGAWQRYCQVPQPGAWRCYSHHVPHRANPHPTPPRSLLPAPGAAQLSSAPAPVAQLLLLLPLLLLLKAKAHASQVALCVLLPLRVKPGRQNEGGERQCVRVCEGGSQGAKK